MGIVMGDKIWDRGGLCYPWGRIRGQFWEVIQRARAAMGVGDLRRRLLPDFWLPPPTIPRARACSIRAWAEATMAVIAGHACSVAELMVPSIFMMYPFTSP